MANRWPRNQMQPKIWLWARSSVRESARLTRGTRPHCVQVSPHPYSLPVQGL